MSGVDAKRYTKSNERPGQIRIDHNSTVTMVREIQPDQANIEFRYTAAYGPVGVIRMEGNLVYQCEAAQLTKQWQTTNQLPPESAQEIHNAVMRACVPQAVGIARDIQLPPPIPLPSVNFKQQADKADAHVPGPEVM